MHQEPRNTHFLHSRVSPSLIRAVSEEKLIFGLHKSQAAAEVVDSAKRKLFDGAELRSPLLRFLSRFAVVFYEEAT